MIYPNVQCVMDEQERKLVKLLKNRMGIPQGLLLVPMLCTLFISDLPASYPEADDNILRF